MLYVETSNDIENSVKLKHNYGYINRRFLSFTNKNIILLKPLAAYLHFTIVVYMYLGFSGIFF